MCFACPYACYMHIKRMTMRPHVMQTHTHTICVHISSHTCTVIVIIMHINTLWLRMKLPIINILRRQPASQHFSLLLLLLFLLFQTSPAIYTIAFTIIKIIVIMIVIYYYNVYIYIYIYIYYYYYYYYYYYCYYYCHYDYYYDYYHYYHCYPRAAPHRRGRARQQRCRPGAERGKGFPSIVRDFLL